MAKIRGVKPEFWTDEDVIELSIPARLLFIGLWNLACDNGHVPDKPKQIKIRILPADDVDVDALLDELAANRRITRDAGTITIFNFVKHQKPHKRWWVTCDLPLCEVPEGASQHGLPVAQPLGNGGTTTDVDNDGDGDSDNSPTVSGPRKRGTRLPEGWLPEPEVRRQMAGERPDIDLVAEHAKFCDHWKAQPGQRGVKLDWAATWRNWMRNARAAPRPRPSSGTHDFSAAMARAAARDAQRELTA